MCVSVICYHETFSPPGSSIILVFSEQTLAKCWWVIFISDVKYRLLFLPISCHKSHVIYKTVMLLMTLQWTQLLYTVPIQFFLAFVCRFCGYFSLSGCGCCDITFSHWYGIFAAGMWFLVGIPCAPEFWTKSWCRFQIQTCKAIRRLVMQELENCKSCICGVLSYLGNSSVFSLMRMH